MPGAGRVWIGTIYSMIGAVTSLNPNNKYLIGKAKMEYLFSLAVPFFYLFVKFFPLFVPWCHSHIIFRRWKVIIRTIIYWVGRSAPVPVRIPIVGGVTGVSIPVVLSHVVFLSRTSLK